MIPLPCELRRWRDGEQQAAAAAAVLSAIGGVVVKVLGNAMYQQSREPVRCPEKLLLLAILYRAIADANGAKNVHVWDVNSAWEFVESDLFVELCDFVGVRPSLRNDLLLRLRLSEAVREVCL